MQEFTDELITVINPETSLILLGDFNSRTGELSDCIIVDRTSYVDLEANYRWVSKRFSYFVKKLAYYCVVLAQLFREKYPIVQDL